MIVDLTLLTAHCTSSSTYKFLHITSHPLPVTLRVLVLNSLYCEIMKNNRAAPVDSSSLTSALLNVGYFPPHPFTVCSEDVNQLLASNRNPPVTNDNTGTKRITVKNSFLIYFSFFLVDDCCSVQLRPTDSVPEVRTMLSNVQSRYQISLLL